MEMIVDDLEMFYLIVLLTFIFFSKYIFETFKNEVGDKCR